ncbi:MAG: type I restriction enzyme HsdR N-terminal domain-containing protein [Gammaproteobacteria bacterium]|nr:type I restriction enzyme HsdR N-terminal domain-containing protein [Gammaproteobacteria bacterium]
MEKESLSKFEQELKAYAEKMEGIFAHCDSEEQTKVSMINPFVELLDYDVRDPRVCKFEFVVNPKGGGTRVDYALFCKGRQNASLETPTILIEAKAASNDLTHTRLLGQISDYADLVSSVEFVALTNGRIWKWFRKEKNSFGDRKLYHQPFITHDVLRPLAGNSRELKFLKKISFQSFDSNSARQAADEVRLSDLILQFFDEIKESPGDDLRRLMFKRWGLKTTKRETELFEQVWSDCFDTFIASQARRMQIDEILEQSKDDESKNVHQTQGVVVDSEVMNSIQSNEHQNETSSESDGTTRSFDTDTGVVTLNSRRMKRAWKPFHQRHWKVEANAKVLYVNVCKHLASIHTGGPHDFYSRCENLIFTPEDLTDNPETQKRYTVIDNGFYLYTNLNKSEMRQRIEKLESLVSTSIERPESQKLVDVWLPKL